MNVNIVRHRMISPAPTGTTCRWSAGATPKASPSVSPSVGLRVGVGAGLGVVSGSSQRRLPQRRIRSYGLVTSAASGNGGGNSGDGSGGRGGGGGDSGAEGGEGGDGRLAVLAGMMMGLFACLTKYLIVWCTEPSITAQVSALLDAGYLLFLGPFSAAVLFLSPPWAVSVGLVVAGAAFMHLVGEMAISAAQPRAGWGTDLWVHHVTATAMLAIVILFRIPGVTMDGLRLMVVECSTGIVAAFSEARRSRQLKGERSVVLGLLMMSAFTWRALYSTKLIWSFVAARHLQGIMVAGGLLAASASVLCITPLWLLNFYWAAKVWASGLKIAGVVKKPEPDATKKSRG